MKSIILKLTLAALVLGLWAATPSTSHAQMRRQLIVQGNGVGTFNHVNIFSMPQFQLMTDPRGAGFGFTQQLVFGPTFRGSFSPFSQTAVFASNSSSMLVFNPMTGPMIRVNTPAIMAFSFSPLNGLRQLNIPSVSVFTNVNGTVASLNSSPQFLTGNFNFTIPFNGMFTLAVPTTSLNTTAMASGTSMMSMSNSMMSTAAMNTGLTNAQTAALLATTMNTAPTRFFSVAQGLAMGLTLNQIVHSPMSPMFGMRTWNWSGGSDAMWWGSVGTQGQTGNWSAAQASAMYNGYVPPSMVMR